jgi:hypothetical protein
MRERQAERVSELFNQKTLENLLREFPHSKPRFERLVNKKLNESDYLWFCPWKLLGKTCYEWQKQVLSKRLTNWIICGARGSGKTAVVAAAIFVEAVLNGNFAIVISASGDQVCELHRRFKEIYTRFPVVKGDVQKTQAEFENGGRVVTRPASEVSSRGWHGAKLLVLDEASRIPDEIFAAIGPTISISRGRKMAVSTPFGKRGWFWDQWDKSYNHHMGTWAPMFCPWQRCPRITPQIVEDYRSENGDLAALQEYECRFLDLAIGSPFNMSRWEGMLSDFETIE